MPKSKEYTSKITKYTPTRIMIISVFIISLCLIIFGSWIYIITFFIPKEPTSDEIMQKRLSINSKLYVEVMENIKANKQVSSQEQYNDPFER